jgi:alpha-tubulin suppressor-like RCC1 family protein
MMLKFRYSTRSVALTYSCLIGSFTVGCGGGDPSGPSKTTPVTPTTPLMAPSATVAIGGSVQRRVFIGNQLVENAVWKSADNAIATVSSSGIVTGVTAGTTTIEASASSNTWSAEITVADLKFQQLVVGGRQACAKSDIGQWYCWGDNGVATLGRLTGAAEICQSQRRECITTPRIPTGLAGFSKIAISGGGLMCGLSGQGEISCWGRNDNYQYFSAPTETCEVYSGADNVPNTFFPCSHTAVLIPSQVRFSDIGAGTVVCGIASDGAAHCWGGEWFGQLGIPTTGTCDGIPCVPSPVAPVPNLYFRQLSVGAWTTCGITTSNLAYCWGSNASGQRGADVPDGMTPNLISGEHVFQTVSIFRDHACGVSVEGDGYCWGSNAFGQLGNAEVSALSSTPQLIPGGLKFTSITPGLDFTCGLTTSGEAYCWGNNIAGALGDGTTLSRSTPAPVIGGHHFTNLQSGRLFTCGLTVERRVYCWGEDVFGDLGNGEQGAALFGAYFSTKPVGVGGLP